MIFKAPHLKSVFLFFILIFSISITAQTILNIPVVSGRDDAEERISDGNISRNSSDLELYNDASDQEIGIRFRNISVPLGAIITNAYVQFTVDETDEDGAIIIGIAGEAIDNSPQFTNTNFNISNRTKTTTKIETWSPTSWTSIGASGAAQRTPDIKSIVQEIVNRGGWVSNNSMSFIFYKPASVSSTSANRTAISYNKSASQAPVLHIEYVLIPTPEIDIVGNGTSIPNNNTVISITDDTDFGNTTTGASVDHTFTIQNTGTLPLNLSGSPIVSISGDASFSIISQPTATTIASGGNLSFTVRYNPAVTGLHTATVSIVNNDANENPYVFNVQGSNLMLPAGGDWTYLDDGSNQGTSWYTTLFPSSGNAELGYGDGDETTVVSYGGNASNKHITTYFTKAITVSAADAANSTLVMKIIRDDGMVVHINGVEVWRDNVPFGPVLFNTPASGAIGGAAESTWLTQKIPNVLVAGTNYIAVEIHQANSTSSDISFNFELYTNNDYVFVPPPAPDVDVDGVDDYIDSDDDNDGVPDIAEGCYTANFEGLNSVGGVNGPEEEISGTLNGTTLTMDDGNTIDFTVTGTFASITSYYAGEHGWAMRTKGANTLGTITYDFGSDVMGLFFKLVDFDENETYTVNVYDNTNTLIDLTISNNIYHLGSYITQVGNTFNDQFFGLAPNNNGDVVASDAEGSVYFYFPTTAVSRIEFIVDQPGGSTIRIAAMHFCGLDTDGDGVDDYYDSDSDNDGIPDLVEAGGTDIDGDGIIDVSTDTDHDGLFDMYDMTPNVYFAEEVTTLPDYDFDGDGFKSRIDLDSDNDGIVDIIEAGGVDINGDGKLDAFVDADSDGFHDNFDGANSILITGADTDADGFPNSYLIADDADSNGLPNFMDIDSDDDGITDNTEAQATGLYVAHANSDTDSGGVVDGIDDNYDDDNVGFGGRGLLPVDSDFDGIPDYLDTDSDDAEELDIIEGHDTNGDGVINGSDTANADTGLFTGVDSDNDGLDDGFDNNDAGFDATNGGLRSISHPIFDAAYDRDWRATAAPIDFDGLNDHIDFGDQHKINGPYSYEAWILQENTPVTGSGTIISKRDVNAGSRRGYHLTVQPNNRINARWFDNSGTAVLNITTPYAITNNKWHHVAFVYDGTDATIYIDGVAMVSASPSALPFNTNEKSLIGAMYNSATPKSPRNYFNGYIDEVRFWDVALSANQIHEMMNQEIQQNGTAVRGAVVPRDISGGLLWNDLDGYYNLNANNAIDNSSKGILGIPKNITTLELQTAPMPYISVRNGNWSDTSATTPWLYGNSVWNSPSGVSVDGSTTVDWNIVVVDKHIITANQDVKLLALISNSDALITDEEINDSQLILGADGNDYELNISRYLKLDGKIDLENESQLVQSNDSWLDVDSKGYAERDQQGTANSYTYNYWSSPVGLRSTTANNVAFTIPNVLRDGSDAANPGLLDFDLSDSDYYYADGAATTPRKIGTYWLWKFVNLPDLYANWDFVGSTGIVNPTEGYTMKGTSGVSAITDEQNYVFRGKPNNGNLVHTTFGGVLDAAGQPFATLAGNPYLSALDADAFIDDNIASGTNSITGTLYFWEHWSDNTHILRDYQGGYALYTKAGGTAATSHPDIDQGGAGNKSKPGQFIPVAQGFYVVQQHDDDGSGNLSNPSSGAVVFKNHQRIFEVEQGNSESIFTRQENLNEDNLNAREEMVTVNKQRVWLGFESPKGYHRQVLAAFLEGATDGIDQGYDGKMIDIALSDGYFEQEGIPFSIVAYGEFDEEREIPITILIGENDEGIQKIMIDEIENISADKNIYIKDNVTNVYHDLRASTFEISLSPGVYKNRFSMVFKNQVLAVDDELLASNTITVFSNNPTKEITIINTGTSVISKTTLYNTLGQIVNTWKYKDFQEHISLPTDHLSTGVYIVQLETDKGIVSKKVLIE